MKTPMWQYRNRLSPRELEVSLLVELPNKQIANVLNISPNTVKEHVRKAMQKTGTQTRTALRILVIQQELTLNNAAYLDFGAGA
jgi:DNA-binding NarL/FixJ family response regulator